MTRRIWILVAITLLVAHKAEAIISYQVATFSGGSSSGCSLVIPGTSIGVGASCMPTGDFPTLTNPHDPINFDACSSNPTACENGTQDITGALNAAFNAGTDVKINNPGTYLANDCQDCSGPNAPWSTFCSGSQLCSTLNHVNTSHNGEIGFQPPANTTLECAPGVTIKTTRTAALSDGGLLDLINSGVKVIGCTFQGTGTSSPVPFVAGDIFAIAPEGGTNDVIEGNTFSGFQGNAAIETLPENGVTTNLTVKYNNFQNLAYYAFVVASQMSTNSIDHNVFIDSTMGAEWDSCTTGTVGTGILFANNYGKSVAGDCTSVAGGCDGNSVPGYFPANNASPTCNYNGVTVGGSAANENYCLGTNGIAIKYGPTTDGASGTATISHNIVDTGCTCTAGVGNC